MENNIERIFNKVFKEVDENINIESNQLNVTCLTSKNNKFHLDSDGNLFVNSITAVQKDTSSSDIYDMIYPIGSIYLSINPTNPSTLFGGTWTSFGNGQTIVGVDTSQDEFYAPEKTGGEKTHKLTKDELPNYNLSSNNGHVITWAGSHNGNVGYSNSQNQYSQNAWADKQLWSMGKDKPHNNLQPFITVYMWKRIS